MIIYGAGESGRQLLTALHQGDQYQVGGVRRRRQQPAAFSVINGLQVARPEELRNSLVAQHDITQVLLAIPSASPERRKEIINSLVGLPVYVRTVPGSMNWCRVAPASTRYRTSASMTCSAGTRCRPIPN